MNPIMGGWKTWLSALGMVALGIVDIVNGDTEAGIQKFVFAAGLIGIGNKIEKINK